MAVISRWLRDPSSRTARHSLSSFYLSAVAAYLAFGIVLATYYCRLPPSPDQSQFDYMAWLDLHGAPFYRGAFDMTWPGQLVIHELGVVLFGVHAWTARLTDFLYLQLGTLALFIFNKNFGFRRASYVVAVLYPLVYVTSGSWMAGHRDIIAMHWLIMAAAIRGRSRWAAVFVGLCCGYAVATRPTYLIFAPLILLGDAMIQRTSWREFVRHGVGMASGIGFVAALFLVVGWIRGLLPAWYEDTVLFVINVYPAHQAFISMLESMGRFLRDVWWLTASAMIGFGMLIYAQRVSLVMMRIASLTLVAVISYFAQNKGFGYHLGGLIPIFTLLTAIGIDIALRDVRKIGESRKLPLLAAILVVSLPTAGAVARVRHQVIPVLGDYKVDKHISERNAIVAEVSRTRPNEYFYQFGWNYDVAFLTQRFSPTSLINSPALNLIDRRSGRFVSWVGKLRDDLSRRPPRFILVDTVDWPEFETGRADTLARQVVLDTISRGYVRRATTKSMILFERSEASAA